MAGERDDLATLAIALALIPLTWWLLLGWSWPHAVFGYDDVSLPGLLAIREMVETGEGWSALVYRPDLLGGVKVANVNGRFPLYELLARLGLPLAGVAVLSAFVVQALLGFLGCRTVADVTAAWRESGRGLTVLERVAVIWLCAFAPALGWRFGVGHPYMVVGLLPFAAALALLVAPSAGTPTLTLVAATTVAVTLGLLHVGQQLVLYAAVFGAPILLGAWLTLGADWRRLSRAGLVVVGALLIALPALWGIVAQGYSSDSPRFLGGPSITYGFVTASAADWVTSIPWMRPALPAGLRSTFAHEVNYPVGAIVLLLALVPWRRARALGIGLALGLVMILVFSMDVAPFSRALLAAIPPLNAFRVPARSALLWLWVLPILAAVAILSREGMATRPRWIVGLAVPFGALLFLAPPLVREIGVALLVVSVTALSWWGRHPLPAALVLLVLGIASVGAFKERLSPYLDAPALFAAADDIGAAVRKVKPAFEESLTRVHLELEVPPFAASTAFAAGLSSLDGYAVPTRRFSALVAALRGDRYEPTTNFFRFTTTDPALGVLRHLYNITDRVALVPPRGLAVVPLGPTAGPAWFSAGVARADDPASLARALTAAADSLPTRLHEVVWLDGRDPLAARAPLPPALDDRCREARVVAVHARRRALEIVTEVATPAACPLTLALNFTEDLEAAAVLDDARRTVVPIFPVYGALTGILVPARATAIHLRARPVRVPGAPAWPALGLACCLVGAWLTRRMVSSST